MIARALLLSFIALSSAAADPPRLNSRALDAAIYAEVKNGFSGTVLVARRTAVFERSYGDSIVADSFFWIASLGKQFVAAAVLDSVDGGRIGLKDPVSKFFPDAPADKRDVTVQELLSHTSGFAPADSADGAANRDAAVHAIFAQPVAGPRGKFLYSNDNYQLATALVEVVEERPYKEIARELWRKADMRYSGFSGEPGSRQVARARGKTPERLAKTSWGSQGVFSNASDLLRWTTTLRRGRVISQESADLMFRGVIPISEGEAGLAWFAGRDADGKRYFFTRGNEDWGPNGLVSFYPDTDTTVIIVTHAGDANAGTSWSRFMLAKILPLL